MFKRLIVAVCILVLALVGASYGATSNTYVSGSSVTFTTTAIAPCTVVTFNTITKRIMVRNKSITDDAYMDIVAKDINGTTGGCSNPTIFLPAAGKTTSETIVIDFSTKNLSFKPDGAGGNDSGDFIEYTVFSDVDFR